MDHSDSPRALTGILWMLVTGMCFVAVTALVKYLGPRIPPAEAAFLRYVIGLFLVLPGFLRLRDAGLDRRMHLLFAGRGLLHSLGVILWFLSMTRIPIAEVTALNYLSPVFVTLGAVLLLGERLAIHRISAIIAALIGAAIIIRPGFREINEGHLAMLVASIVFGGSYLLGKMVADRTNSAVVVVMLSVWVTIGTAPMAIAVWVTPDLRELAILLGVALFATAGHYTMTLAFKAAPITVTQPITYLQLVWATALGVLFFAEPLDLWVLIGGSVILASVTFITWREAVLKRRNITPPAPATKL